MFKIATFCGDKDELYNTKKSPRVIPWNGLKCSKFLPTVISDNQGYVCLFAEYELPDSVISYSCFAFIRIELEKFAGNNPIKVVMTTLCHPLAKGKKAAHGNKSNLTQVL